ncbi:alpha/beta fold hydrolase [Salipiger mucosus]|uniref:Esterase EstC, putative n=1 Tax=Salipiger mucosus DSM 16094 TaxID=1123237 RepID=S9QWN0_9RHOB|nr:alpha/beta fold hydrolase [Salipiger mucosus]EPX85806.1 esterase EstC, putative [Salipiger mucosus DSM 16094]
MTRMLLVHGSAHGAWCWRDVIPELEALGHEGRAIDLPSHGADPTPPETVGLEDYVQAILDALDGPTMVVAHSMGGVPMTQAADRAPELFERLVYLCAYMPGDGDSVASMRRAGPRQPLAPAIMRDPGGVTMRFDPALAREVFYHDCSDAAVAFALDHLTPQAIRPQQEPVSLTGRVESLQRSYIVCGEDGAIPPEYQRSMAAALPPAQVHERPWSHSPFLGDPKALAALLDHIAAAG